jgi:hypothetical protein
VKTLPAAGKVFRYACNSMKDESAIPNSRLFISYSTIKSISSRT